MYCFIASMFGSLCSFQQLCSIGFQSSSVFHVCLACRPGLFIQCSSFISAVKTTSDNTVHKRFQYLLQQRLCSSELTIICVCGIPHRFTAHDLALFLCHSA